MPKTISTATLSFYGSLSIIVTGFVMMAVTNDWKTPDARGMAFVLGLITVASLGTLAISTAMRLGDVSAISPFRYVRVVFGVGAGVLLFGERIDAAIIIGSIIVVGAGLYSWNRERRLALAAQETA